MPNTTVMQAKRLGVFSCQPDTPLVDAAHQMTDEDVSALVVADAEGGLIGIITRIDLLRAHAAHADWSKYRVGDYMNPNVVTVGLDTTLSEVSATLLGHHIHRVVAVRREGDKFRPVAVVSAADLVYHMVKNLERTTQ
jgi:signal-transduction protein with cAMP-binding, CBS, and nucleotidyltransferase domain